jgi:hypothetical protein
MTSIEKIKHIKSRGFSLSFIAKNTGIDYFKMYRAMRGGKGLEAAENNKIDRVFALVEAFENEE